MTDNCSQEAFDFIFQSLNRFERPTKEKVEFGNRLLVGDLEYTAGRNLKGLHGEGKLWETIEDCVQCDKQCDMRGLRWRIQAHKVTLHVIPPFRKFFKENERNFSEAGDGVRIYPDGVVIFDEKKLGSS
ncbi:hypothetical protein Tco_1163447 [Tanacetum coccineum]